jgi:hypothetical protein
MIIPMAKKKAVFDSRCHTADSQKAMEQNVADTQH